MKNIKILIPIVFFLYGIFLTPVCPNNDKNPTVKKEFYENGKLRRSIPYIDGKKEGVEIGFYENDILMEEIEYKNGLKDGIEKIYFPTGKLWRLTHYRNDKKHGLEKTYFESGELANMENYYNDKQEGEQKFFYDWGQLYSIEFYEDGKKEGYQKVFYPFGILHISFYKNGKLFGEEIERDNHGDILKKTLHDGKGNSKIIVDSDFTLNEKMRELKDKALVSNSKYLVFTGNEDTLVICNQENLKVHKKHFKFKITGIEACSSYPYINIETFKGTSNSRKYVDYIYDIAQDLLHETTFFNYGWREENRWAEDGQLTFISKKTSFEIIETKFLVDYINNKQVPLVLKINGHPKGYIMQAKWMEDYLFYSASVIDWEKCWGFYNFKNGKNYFITCCGLGVDKIEYNKSCDDFVDFKPILNIFASIVEKNELIEISNDFYKDVFKITGNKTWEAE